MKKIHITVLPFLGGAWLMVFFGIGSFEFSLSATVVMGLMGITGQAKWY